MKKGTYTQTRRNEAMTKTEINLMFNKAENKEIKAIMSVMLMTGSRISEVLLLKGKDISSDEEHIIINSYVLKKRHGKVDRLIKKVKKTHIYFSYFKDWINSHNFKEESYIFKTSRGYVWKAIKLINPETTPHLFRHTVATMLGEFMDVFTLQRWMGWTKLEMAARYVHPKNVIQAGIDAMEKSF